ncbi:hypothetical protein Tco_0869439 [Tanacetum coccineum]
MLGIKHFRVSTAKGRVSTAKPTVSTARRKQFVLLKITTASTKSSYYCWFKITVVGEKVNAVESLLVVSTEIEIHLEKERIASSTASLIYTSRVLKCRFRIHFDIPTKSLPLLFWIHQRYHQEELYIHKEEMAPMALSDSEVKTCSKTCLKNYESLKKQYDDLVARKHETEFKAINYKRGLDTVEAQLVTYRKNEEKEGVDFKIEKFENASKDLDKLLGSQITDNSKKGLGYNVVPPPHPLIYNRPNKLDLSYSGLEEFQDPEFVGYGVKVDKIVFENSSIEIKKTPDAPIIEEWVSDDEEQDESPVVVEKKIVVPTIPKVNVVKSKQQEKPVRKPVKYAEMYRSQKPRGNQRNWNNLKSHQLGSDFVMIKKACYVCGSFEHLQYTCKHKRHVNDQKQVQKPIWNNARRVDHHNSHRMYYPHPKRNFVPKAVLMKTRMRLVAKPKAAYNAVKRNMFNDVKALACWVWMPKNRVVDHVSKNISALVTLKRLDYINAQGRFKSMMAWVHKCSKEKEESREECSKKLLMLGSSSTAADEKVNDAGKSSYVSTEVNAN